jgi:nitrite reductase/ring-hydroxylating ferredoxin subunit
MTMHLGPECGQPPVRSTRADQADQYEGQAVGGDGRSGQTTACDGCPALANRRAFLRHAALAAVATLAAAGLSPAGALAETVGVISPRATAGRDSAGTERSYAIPTGDSIAVDVANDLILARWQNRVYAFSLRCPHRGTRLEWHAEEGRIFCPKHKARFRPDGAYDSGRRTRALDRYAVRRQGAQLVVDLAAVLREDADALRWATAAVTVA